MYICSDNLIEIQNIKRDFIYIIIVQLNRPPLMCIIMHVCVCEYRSMYTIYIYKQVNDNGFFFLLGTEQLKLSFQLSGSFWNKKNDFCGVIYGLRFYFYIHFGCVILSIFCAMEFLITIWCCDIRSTIVDLYCSFSIILWLLAYILCARVVSIFQMHQDCVQKKNNFVKCWFIKT